METITIKGYVIICDVSQNILSHDWGTEFYHEIHDAKNRAQELNEGGYDGTFTVQKVSMIFE